MTASLKKISVLVLLLCIAAPVFFYAGFVIKQHNIRSSMKQQLKKQLLQTVTVEKRSIVWYDDGKEVSINGRMFDVVSVKEEGSNIILTGLYDTDEDKLHDALNKAMHQNNKQQPLNNLLVKIFSLQAASFKLIPEINIHWKYVKPVYGFCFQEIPSAPSVPLLHPPQV